MLSIKNLSGGYSHIPVIHQVNINVKPGEIVGLIGLNGAGKSTTIKHILGLLEPLEGSITLDGKQITEDPAFFRSQITYIPETPQFYEELTLWEHLQLTALAYDIPDEKLQKRSERLLHLFRMENKRNWFPSVFSKGMQQKLMILSAFLVESTYLIIDEPFVGLDPLAIQALLSLLNEKKENGTGILLSTHILDMAEKHCNRFTLLHHGQVQLQGTLQEMRATINKPDATLEELFMHSTRNSA